MSKFQLPKAINDTQRVFAELCEKGGGVKGGPARTKVLELLIDSGKNLNKFAYAEMEHALKDNPNANPWHVCFAVGLCWGHLAELSPAFIEAAVNFFEKGDASSLNAASLFHYERGPDPISQSLRGGRVLFAKVVLPQTLPDSLKGMGRAQERWLAPIISPERPKYIGSWNATAMFLTALFANPSLAAALVSPEVMLPPSGPIYGGLALLHKTHILSKAPDGSELDDSAFEPGSIYANTALMSDLLQGTSGSNLVEIHSGLFMLGTRFAGSDKWF